MERFGQRGIIPSETSVVYVNTFFEKRVEQLFDLAKRLDAAFTAAGLDYRVVGGLAAYLYVEDVEPDAGRLTKDIDITVRREDLEKIKEAVAPFGFQYRQRMEWTCSCKPESLPDGAQCICCLPARKFARPGRTRLHG